MEERTTTVVKITSATKKDPLRSLFKNLGRGKDSVAEQEKVTKCHVFRKKVNNLQSTIEAMEERTTTVVRIIPATKKDPLRSLFKTWAGVDSNHRTLSGTDLQSVAFSHSATYPY